MAMHTSVPALPVGNTTAELQNKVGVKKQLVVDTTKNTLSVMDGVTPGGHPLAKESRKLISSSSNLTLNGGAQADLSGDITLAITGVAANGATFVGLADANELTTPGQYFVTMTGDAMSARNWPQIFDARTYVRVTESDQGTIFQEIVYNSALWVRYGQRSGNSVSWGAWHVLSGIRGASTVAFYLSKNGDDSYHGGADHPLLTVEAAMQKISVLHLVNPSATVALYFGPGEWGSLNFSNTNIPINIYSSSGVADGFSSSLPHFDQIGAYGTQVGVGSVYVDRLVSSNSGFLAVTPQYVRTTYLLATYGGFINLQSSEDDGNILEFVNGSGTDPNTKGIKALDGGIIVSYNKKLRLASNIAGSQFVYCGNDSTIVLLPGHCELLSSSNAFTGRKYYIAATGNMVSTKAFMDSLYGQEDGLLDVGASINRNFVLGGSTILTREYSNTPRVQTTKTARETGSATYDSNVYIRELLDKNGKLLLQEMHKKFKSDGNMMYLLNLFSKNDDDNDYISFGLAEVAGGKYAQAPCQLNKAQNLALINLEYLNSRLGTGASVASISMLDMLDDDYVETLEEQKQAALFKLNQEAQQAIYAGFLFEIDGQEYRIDYSLFDQTNLQSDAILAMQNPGKIMAFRCIDENGQVVWLDISAETILAIQKYGVISHRDVIRRAIDEKKARIMSAADEAEIQAILAE